MRQIVIAFGIRLLLGAASAQEAPAWEYGTLTMRQGSASWFSASGDVRQTTHDSMPSELEELYGGTSIETRGLLAQILNMLGVHGWELVAVDGNFYVFKRPSEP